VKQPTLTAEQSQSARHARGLSQSAVARATGINRSQLALFEVRKYLLPEDKLQTLRDYYEQSGYQPSQGKRPAHTPEVSDLDAEEEAQSPDVATVDGFLVPAGLDEDQSEAWLQEIAANDDEIKTLAGAKVVKDFWSGEPLVKQRDEILRRMARNYCLVRALQGHEALPAHAEDGTAGALVRRLLDPSAAPSGKKASSFADLFI
jgi:transcriptional regulator with XRE-family HTH domain